MLVECQWGGWHYVHSILGGGNERRMEQKEGLQHWNNSRHKKGECLGKVKKEATVLQSALQHLRRQTMHEKKWEFQKKSGKKEHTFSSPEDSTAVRHECKASHKKLRSNRSKKVHNSCCFEALEEEAGDEGETAVGAKNKGHLQVHTTMQKMVIARVHTRVACIHRV